MRLIKHDVDRMFRIKREEKIQGRPRGDQQAMLIT
jgi:hypothetical protein